MRRIHSRTQAFTLVMIAALTILSACSEAKVPLSKAPSKESRARDLLKKLPRAMAEVESYSFVTITKAGSGQSRQAIKVEGEYQAPDKNRVVVSGPGYRRELIITRTKTYVRGADGAWKSAPATGDQISPIQTIGILATPLRATVSGPTAKGPYYRIKASYKANSFIPLKIGNAGSAWLAQTQAIATIRIDKATNRLFDLVVRVRPKPGSTLKDLTIDTDSRYSAYDAGQKVVVPAP